MPTLPTLCITGKLKEMMRPAGFKADILKKIKALAEGKFIREQHTEQDPGHDLEHGNFEDKMTALC